MQVTDESDLKLDAALRRAAESEMRRTLPGDERPNKRAKGEYAGQVGRFDYSSVRDLASGVQGFLIWSDFRREKSSANAAASLLLPHLVESKVPEDSNAAVTALAGTEQEPSEAPAADSAPQEDASGDDSQEDKAHPCMTVIKLSARGLAALRLLPRDGEGPDATAQRGLDAALAIYDAVQAGTCPTPKYLLRFMPFASTCLLELKALGQCAARLAPLAAPLLQGAGHPTFGIGLHNRRTEHNNGKGSDIDRMEMIKAAAAGFTQALKEQFGVDACVDLKAPAVVLCIEVVSVMGQLYACMGALPQRVCMLKPKLAMQHLAAHAGKASAGKGDRQTGSKAGPAAQESEPTPAA